MSLDSSPREPSLEWQLRFYIAGHTPRASSALESLLALFQARAPGRFAIEVVDLSADPPRAAKDEILALPCLVRCRPEPKKMVVGFPRDAAKLADELGLPDLVI